MPTIEPTPSATRCGHDRVRASWRSGGWSTISLRRNRPAMRHPSLVYHYLGGQPPPRQQYGATRRGHASPDRDTASGSAEPRMPHTRHRGCAPSARGSAGRMAVGCDLVAERTVAILLAPALREGEEEALVAGQSVEHRRRLAAERGDISLVRGDQAGDIGDVLAKHLLTVDVDAGQRLVGIVLCDQGCALFLEVREIGRRPPVAQPAARVEFGAVVVEAVADLVPDGGADRTVIGRGIRLGIVERRLQDRGGKVQGVLQRQVDRVHRLRRHPPFGSVDRLADLGELVPIFGKAGAAHVADRVVGADGEVRVAAPRLGIADTDPHRLDLAPRLRLRRRRHPGQVRDACVDTRRGCR